MRHFSIIRIFIVLFILSKASSAYSLTVTIDGFEYWLYTDRMEANLQKAPLGNTVIIPDSVVYEGNSYHVTIIGMNSFLNRTDLQCVVLPKYCNRVILQAFTGCNNLTTIVMNDGLEIIGESAFRNNTKLNNVVFPKSLISIGAKAFDGCKSLKEMFFLGDTPPKVENQNAFSNKDALIYTAEDNVENYQSHDFWKSFTAVKPTKKIPCYPPTINFANDTITILPLIDQGATIYFTTDGSVPDNYSHVYSEPFLLNHNATIKAACMHEDFLRSSITEYKRNDLKVSTPSVTLSADFVMTMECSTPEAEIYYHINESSNSYSSGGWSKYQEPVRLEHGSYVRVKAQKSGWNDSDVKTYDYYTPYFLNLPVINYDSSSKMVSITHDDPEATIYYTIDGSTPSRSSSVYKKPFLANRNLELKAIAVRETFLDSKVQGKKIVYDSSFQTENIFYKLIDNSFADEVEVISNNSKYKGDIIIPSSVFYDGVNYSVTRIAEKAFYYCDSLFSVKLPSTIIYIGKSAFYECSNLSQISFSEGLKEIDDAAFCYCTKLTNLVLPSTLISIGSVAFGRDESLRNIYTYAMIPPLLGDNVFDNAWTIITNSITLHTIEGCEIKYQEADQWKDFNNILSFKLVPCCSPTFDYRDYKLSLHSLTQGASIYYTLDGSDPTLESMKYSEPFWLTRNCKVRAISVYDGYLDSDISEFDKNDFKVSTPKITISEDFILAISCESPKIPGVSPIEIRYNIEKNTNSYSGYKKYDEPIKLEKAGYVWATAYIDGWKSSEKVWLDCYKDYYVKSPNINWDQNTNTVTITGDGAIYYSLDGSIPTEKSMLYDGPFQISRNLTVKAISTVEKRINSEVATKTITGIDCKFYYKGIYYKLTDYSTAPEVEITSGAEYEGDIIIPQNVVYNGTNYIVVRVGDSAFQDCKKLASVLLPNTIKVIGLSAFQGCLALKTIDIPSSVETIAPYAFRETGIQSIYFHEGLKVIKENAFYNPSYSKGKLSGKILFPSTLKEIHSSAFKGNPLITEIEFTGEMSIIGSSAFEDCSSLNAVNIPMGIKELSSNTFYGCSMLKEVTIPSSVQEIENDVFNRCSSLKTIVIPENVKIIGNNAFYGCISLEQVSLPSTLQTIGAYAFQNCKALTSITLPENLDNILVGAFQGCASINSIYSLSLECPTMPSGNAFNGIVQNSVLYVMHEALNAYKSANYWAEFSRILDLSMPPCSQPMIYTNKIWASIECKEPENASIYYTLDGTMPNSSSKKYSGPFSLSKNCSIKAMAVSDGRSESPVASLQWTQAQAFTCNPPVFSRIKESNVQMEDTIYLSSETEGVEFYYSTDGSTPTAQSIKYKEGIKLINNGTIKAISVKKDMLDSPVSEKIIDWLTVATPKIDFEGKICTISTTTENSTIFYTTDDTDPTTNGILYVKPFAIAPRQTNIKASAIKENWNRSQSSERTYYPGGNTCEAPDVVRIAGTDSILMSSRTEGAVIYYTTNGMTPTTSDSVFTKPILMAQNGTLKAMTTNPIYYDSEVSTLNVNWFKVNQPVITVEDKIITISCAKEGATIHYTLDGTEPTEENTVYRDRLTMTGSCVIKAVATFDNFNNSNIVKLDYRASEHACATPEFTKTDSLVTINCATEGNTTIYYTTDGSTPTAKSEVYTEPIRPVENGTIKAIAMNAKLFDSEEADYEVGWFKTENPEIISDGIFIEMACATPNSKIYYTLDGTAPNEESPVYSGRLTMTGTCTIKALAVRENFKNSAITTIVFDKAQNTVAAPLFQRSDSLIAITSASPDGTIIYYTVDGTDPTTSSEVYEKPVKASENFTLKAIAVNPKMFDSPVGSYKVNWFKADMPVLSFDGFYVSMSCATAGSRIFYTLDGTSPNEESLRYSEAVRLGSSCTVKAVAMRDNFNNSPVVTASFDRGDNTVGRPQFERSGDTLYISSQSALDGTVVYYTTDGSDPTTASTQYAAPVVLQSNCTVKAIGVNPKLFTSETSTYDVNWFRVEAPVITFDGIEAEISTQTPGSKIFYTLDGKTPSEESLRYVGPVTMTDSCTVRAIAVRENYNNSAVSSVYFDKDRNTASRPLFQRSDSLIAITSASPDGTTIYYTVDGTDPTTSSEVYEKPVKASENFTLKAIAVNPKMFDSPVGSYEVNWFKVDEPVISFDGIYATITCAMPNSKIHYTLDSTTPTEESPLYTGQLTMSSSCNIKAIAMREHFNNSSVVTMAFDKNQNMVGKPQFQHTDSTITISATPLEGTIIYYTTDGTEPTVTSEVFRDTIRLNGNCVIKAMATNPKYFQSETGTLDVNWFKVETPEITFDGIMAVMNCATPKARIYYTLDGSAPTEESLKYTSAVAMTASCTVKAIAMRSDYNNSAIVAMAFSRDDNTVGKPMFQRTDSTLAISATPAEGTIIYYTTDGTEPNTTSKVYTERIRFESNCTVRAMATNPKMFTSPEASYEVDWFNVETPEITFDGIMAAVNCGTPNARIYYTLDGTVPTEESLRYNGNIQMTATCTVKAVGVRSGYNNSAVASVAFNKEENTVTKPIFHKTDSTLKITATPAEGTVIYYTTDGTQPNSASTVYADSVRLEGNCTVKAVAMNPKMFDSETADYEVNWFKVEAPEIAFDGIFATIRCATPAARIYYTTDGSTPTEESTKYSGTLTMTTSCTVKAVAVKEKYNSSAIVAMAFSRDDNTVGKPMFQRTDSTLAISAAPAEGTIIYYTTDGTEPNTTSKVYTEKIRFESNCTVRAMATNPKMFTSPEASYDVDWFNVETPEITFDGIMAAVNCGTPNARIYYTLDGTVPTEESLRYNGNIQMTATCTVKAVGVRSGYNNSAVASVAFNKEENTVTKPIFHKTDSTLKITATPAEGTVIYYTTDGTQPNSASTVYADSVRLEGNCTVKAVAMNPKMFDSETADYEVNWFKVEAPEIAFDGIFATLKCSTPAARIYYTTDGSTPTEESTKYSGTLTMTVSCTVKAVAMKEKYNSSAIVAMAFSRDDNTVGKPMFQRTDSTLAISAAPAEGTIIYYTTDGTEPTVASATYTEPLKLNGNCTIRAMAENPKLFQSETADYNVGWFKVETPEIVFDGIIANISCATPNARIFYTTDGTTPTEESPRYMGQLTMSQTCTLKALAVKEDYHNSTVSTMLFDREANTVSTPRIRRNGSQLSISTETVAEGTMIYYTTDGTDPTTESTRYTTEITVDENMTVKALAMNEKLFTSGIATFDVDWFKVATPVLTIDGTTVTANCNTANATLYYTFEEDPTELSKLYTGPIELTDNREVRVIAMRKNYHNSEMASFTPMNFVCQDVTFSYNGRYLQMQAGEGQLIYYTLDGSSPTTEAEIYTDPVDIDMTCTVRAMATRDYWRNSSITAYDVTFVYNGEDVIMEEAGHLEELLNGTGGAQNIESLPVKGKMDSKDLLFIKSMPNLRHLDLTEAMFEGNVLPDEAFAGMSIISFQSPTKITSAGKNLFKGCDQLAAVVWNANVSVPESMVEDVKKNPNFLLYVNSRVYAPSSYKGNLISGGQATSVTLYDTESGGNFCCPQRFYTQQISYTHNYSQQTEKGATRGWETLALPFDVGTITHEKRGSLAPFAKGEDIIQYKPFWLYELKETGFTRTSDIKAYTPYIISMPNNPDYADDYILSGKVTFAAKNIYVEADTTHISMKGSVQFAPAMQRQPKGNSVLVINLEDYTAEDETFYPNGSAFLPDLREVHPFESFALTGASARPILLNDYLWEETSDIEQLEMGMLKEIGKNRGVFDLSGRRIVNESMQKNRKQHQRVYIINGKKTLTK